MEPGVDVVERRRRVEDYINNHQEIYKRASYQQHRDEEGNALTVTATGGEDGDIEQWNISNNTPQHNKTSVQRRGDRTNDDRRCSVETNGTPQTPRSSKQTKRYSTYVKDIDDGIYSRHTQMTSNRLTRLFLDELPTSDVKVNDSFHVLPPSSESKQKDGVTTTATRRQLFNKPATTYLNTPVVARFRGNQDGTQRQKPRGSLYSMTSSLSTSSTSDPVPMNFIPGQTKAMSRSERSNSLALNYIRKARFCFKGVTVKVDETIPRTFKAMAHAGMLSLSVLGPSDHRCSC